MMRRWFGTATVALDDFDDGDNGGVDLLDTMESHFEVGVPLSTQWREFVPPIANAVRIDGSALLLNQASLAHLQMSVREVSHSISGFDDFRFVS